MPTNARAARLLLLLLGACAQGTGGARQDTDPADQTPTDAATPAPRPTRLDAAVPPPDAAAVMATDVAVAFMDSAPASAADAPADDAAATPATPGDAASPPIADAGPAGTVGARVSLQSDLQAKWTAARETIVHEGDTVVFTGAFVANEFGGPRGHTPRLPVSPGHEYLLEYRVRFDSADFPFMKGGKLPGLAGGDAPTGCVNTGPNGFSARMMWRGGGALIGYTYDQDQASGCGNDLATTFTFKSGTWYSMKERVRLNTGRNHDGVLQIWVDGQMVLDRNNMEYMVEASGNLINTVLFHAFFGGSTQGWAPTKACSMSFSDPWVTKLAN